MDGPRAQPAGPPRPRGRTPTSRAGRHCYAVASVKTRRAPRLGKSGVTRAYMKEETRPHSLWVVGAVAARPVPAGPPSSVMGRRPEPQRRGCRRRRLSREQRSRFETCFSSTDPAPRRSGPTGHFPSESLGDPGSNQTLPPMSRAWPGRGNEAPIAQNREPQVEPLGRPRCL